MSKMSNLMIDVSNLQQENFMLKEEIKKLSTITKQDAFDEGWEEHRKCDETIVSLGHENQALRVALAWAVEHVAMLDHDCHASPDSGCRFCSELWDAESLIKTKKEN